jgi:predicted peptidase
VSLTCTANFSSTLGGTSLTNPINTPIFNCLFRYCKSILGAYGVWATSAVFPHKFAALMPIAGGIIPIFKITPAFKQTLHPIVSDILDAHNPYTVLAAKIGKTPVWMFHGRDDKVIPVTESRNINEALRSGGNETVRYTEWEQVGHEEVFIKAFLEPEHYKWLTKQKLTGGK